MRMPPNSAWSGDEHPQNDTPLVASALTEPPGEALTVAHVTGGRATEGFKHGGYVILAGRVDGRSAVARRMRRLAERVARDMGFEGFDEMPAVRQEAVVAFCRTVAASDAMWTSFLVNGRLPDKFWELISLTRKYADLLGLDRVLKEAKAIDLASYVAQRYGGRANGSEIPTPQPGGHPGPSGGPTVHADAAQEMGPPPPETTPPLMETS
jgi:hypothetical protein